MNSKQIKFSSAWKHHVFKMYFLYASCQPTVKSTAPGMFILTRNIFNAAAENSTINAKSIRKQRWLHIVKNKRWLHFYKNTKMIWQLQNYLCLNMKQALFSLVLIAIIFVVLILYCCLRCVAVASTDSGTNSNNTDVVDIDSR